MRISTWPSRCSGRAGWATALLIAFAWTANGGPVVAPVSVVDLPEEILSLGGITGVRLTVSDPPEMLLEHGLTKATLYRRCAEQLDRDGISVEENDDLPRMDIWFKQFGESTADQSAAFISVISIYQPVRVHRLERDMVVPTACFAGGTLVHDGQPVEKVVIELIRRCSNVARAIRLAPVKDGR